MTGGYRVVLTYNLLLEGDLSMAIAPAVAGRLDPLAESIQRFFETPLPRRWAHEPRRERPDPFVYLLDHQYTRRSLAWRRLKNADAVRAVALREVARRLDCEIVLALADVHESWSCEDEGFADRRYGRRGGWWHGAHDEDADEDAGGSETPALLELLDSDIELRHWTGPGEELEAIAGAVDRDEVWYTKPSVELEPFASEHEGYMGNWGNTVDRWYHRAAVVLWPRARTFVIRAKAAPGWAIGELAAALKSREIEKARGMASQLGPFWSRVAPNEKRGGFLARTLGVAGGLDNPELAASLLEPFTLQRLTPSAASRLIPLADRYGLEWCVSTLRGWAAEKRHAHPRLRRGPQALQRALEQPASAERSSGSGSGNHASSHEPKRKPRCSGVQGATRTAFSRNLARRALHRLMQIPVGLKSHPELGRCLQETCEAQGSIGGDAALAEHDLIQTVQRDSKAAGGFDLTDAHWHEELFEQDLTRRNRGAQPVRISSESLRRGLGRHVPAPSGT